MTMATDRPTDLDELLGETAAAKPMKRVRRRLQWSWARLKSLRVEDVPERWFWTLNTGLMLLIVVVALRIACLLMWPLPEAGTSAGDRRTRPEERGTTQPVEVQIPSLATASTRSMFQAGAAPAPKAAAPLSDPAKSVMQKLNVLGIVTGNPTQAVIEDAQTHKTYTVSVGQVLLDGVQVEAIEPWRVIVTWQGESIELRL